VLTSIARMKRLRQTLGLSQREMAREFKVSPGAIGSWEVGDREIPGPIMRLIEIFESELWPTGDNRPNSDRAIQTLMHTFASSTRVTDAELLAKLRVSLTSYFDESLTKTTLMNRVQSLALKRLIESLGEARGIPMKVAQIAAFLDARVPQGLRDVLEEMQAHGRDMNLQTVTQILTEDFGHDPLNLFLEFSRRPVACASLGQVHRARLWSGEEVAVKIQYPHVRARMLADFKETEFLDQLALFAGLDRERGRLLLEDFYQTVLSECDYLSEAAAQMRYAGIFADDPKILVPRVHLAQSSARVITMDWIEGRTWKEFRKSASQTDRNAAAQTISQFFAKSLFGHGLLHADPHPGNYIFMDGGKVAFLDFGRVKKVTPEICSDIHRLHSFVITRDREGTRAFAKSNLLFQIRPEFDFDKFWTASINISNHLHANNDIEISRDQLEAHWQAIKDITQSGTMRVSPEFFWSMLFAHRLMLAGRENLRAAGNWRENLINNMEK